MSHQPSGQSDCLFCKIGRKDVPASLVYEDDQMFVLNDINPQAPLHALVTILEKLVWKWCM